MESYEESYYRYQTRARGLLDEASLRHHFDKLASWYAKRLKSYLPKDRRAASIDVPCGYGNFLYFLRQQGYHNVIGYDLDPEQVRLARLLDLPARKGNALTILGDSTQRYDCISSLDFLEHLSRNDALAFLELCRARLNPGGVLLVRMPCADGPFGAHDRYNDITHQWGATSNLLRVLMEMVGFTRVVILDERPQPHNLIGVLRLFVFYPMLALASLATFALGLTPPKVWSRSMWGIGWVGQDNLSRDQQPYGTAL